MILLLGMLLRPFRISLFVGVALATVPWAVHADGLPRGARPAMVYGGDREFAPYEFVGSDGLPHGLNVDLVRALGQLMGFSVEVRLLSWPEVRTGLEQDHTIDIAAMYGSSERATLVDFAVPHELVYHEIYIRRGRPAITNLEQLAGKNIIVQRGTLAHASAQRAIPNAHLVLVDSEPDALRLLASGQHDAAIVTQVVGRPFIQRHQLSNVIPTGPPVFAADYGFVVAKGRRDLVARLDQGLAILRANGEFDRIYARWIHPPPSLPTALRRARWFLLPIPLLIAIALSWSWLLQRRVAALTSDLRQQLAVRDEFVATAGHELHTPLTALAAQLDALATMPYDAQRTPQKIAATDRTVKRLIALCDRLVDVARLVGGELELDRTSADLSQLAEQVVARFEVEAERAGTTIVLTAPAPVRGHWDPMRLEQVLTNLVANALRYGLRSPVRVEVDVGEGRARLRVRDQGIGVAPDAQARIFERFERAAPSRQFGGLGVGLWLTRRIVEAHGGTICVESMPGRGATFTVLLPLEGAP